MNELLKEFRREVLTNVNKLDDDSFYTKEEIGNLITNSYARAKKRCESSETIYLEDE